MKCAFASDARIVHEVCFRCNRRHRARGNGGAVTRRRLPSTFSSAPPAAPGTRRPAERELALHAASRHGEISGRARSRRMAAAPAPACASWRRGRAGAAAARETRANALAARPPRPSAVQPEAATGPSVSMWRLPPDRFESLIAPAIKAVKMVSQRVFLRVVLVVILRGEKRTGG